MKLRKQFFDPLENNMYDIELYLVMFSEFLVIVFPLLKYHHLVQNGWFSRRSYLQNDKIPIFSPCYDHLKLFLFEKKSTAFFSLCGRPSALSARVKLQSGVKW